MVILGLGSNQGHRLAHLQAAISSLKPIISNMKLSPIYESRAVLPPDAPPEWDMPFLNLAVQGDTNLPPKALLAVVKLIEQELGRTPSAVWAPRVIDIDILAMDDVFMESVDLNIPHHELLNRDFALIPLADLASDWAYPHGEYSGKSAADIISEKAYGMNKHLRKTGLILHA